MATIDKRVKADGGVVYRARVKYRGRETSKTFSRRTDAKKWGRDEESRLEKGGVVSRATVAEAIDKFLEETLPDKRQNKDKRTVKQRLGWWRKQIGRIQLVDVTPSLIAEQRDRLSHTRNRYNKRLSGATCNRYLAAMSAVLKTATTEWQWLDENPLKRVSRRAESVGRVRFLTEEERVRLLKVCKQEDADLYLAVVLALSTGARKSEIRFLRWPQIHLDRQQIILEDTKNSERRALPLHGPALELLRSRIRRVDVDWVFPGRLRHVPMDIDKPWRRALSTAEIDDFRFHDLRHSAASYMAMNGCTPSEIAAVLGHRTLLMVKRYAHLSDTHVSDVIKRMNERIFGDE